MYTIHVLAREDLDRQVVKSNSCSVIIPEFDLTIPPGRGQLTTIEGLIRDIITDLAPEQPLRKIQAPEAYEKIESILQKCRAIVGDEEEEDENADESATGPLKTPKRASEIEEPLQPFTVRLDDPTGNSWAEFVGSMADPKWNMRTYHRTRQQNIELGLIAEDEPEGVPAEKAENADETPSGEPAPIGKEEIFTFPGTCSSCGHPSSTLMQKVNIPYFKVSTLLRNGLACC